MRTLIIPGLNGSGPAHWQTLWEEKYGLERVEQSDWVNPDLALWINTLNDAVTANPERVLLVAHSLGCLTVAHWARAYPENTGQVQSALLVAPPNVELSPGIPQALRNFAIYDEIPFSAIMVGSENDYHMTLESARELAKHWGSRFVNAGPVGHINVDSGHGPWPEGEALYEQLVRESFGESVAHNSIKKPVTLILESEMAF